MEKAPATQVQSVNKALTLASVLLQLDTPPSELKAARCLGVVARQYVIKRITQRAKPLCVQAVKALEEAVVKSDDPRRGNHSGHRPLWCRCPYARC